MVIFINNETTKFCQLRCILKETGSFFSCLKVYTGCMLAVVGIATAVFLCAINLLVKVLQSTVI